MPHRRRKKKEADTRLILDPSTSQLYLRACSVTETELSLPLDTLLVWSVVRFVGAEQLVHVELVVEGEEGEQLGRRHLPLMVRRERVVFRLADRTTLPQSLANCRLPAWYLPEQRTCIAGLCSVVRYALKLAAFSDKDCAELCRAVLGFQMNCLSAPAEVSPWTKFCEIDVPESVRRLFEESLTELPAELSKFEAHLRQPIRIHNVRKRMQQTAKKQVIANEAVTEAVVEAHESEENFEEATPAEDVAKVSANAGESDPIKAFAMEQHSYAEGPDLLISDLLLYPCLFLAFSNWPDLLDVFPLSARWFRLVSDSGMCDVMQELLLLDLDRDQPPVACLPAAFVPEESLYKCDPQRPKQKFVPRQPAVVRNLDWWHASGLENLQEYLEEHVNGVLDWNKLPQLVHPQAGQLPPDRLERKCQQLQGMALAVMQLAAKRPGITIVDFCSGGGHLGLLLAHLIPQAQVHMVENKEESLARARERGVQLALDNVWFYQSNMDYYQGRFDIGTSLHACGVATDIVMQKSLENGSDFVCCPCCYGAVQSLENLRYPRSEAFLTKGCDEEAYIVMGHTADQNHKDTAKQLQGELFMDIVDTDRALMFIEKGYRVQLTKIQPLSCTPKHNLIIGSCR